MPLQEEIDLRSKEIHTDGYSMSIGEIISLYKEKEIDIHPAFQRFYRWRDMQKSKLIESILLGIPIPSMFVAQREDGIWDVIDGLQRLSTIFEFVGELRDESGTKLPPLKLIGTNYLPSLDGKVWDNENELISLTHAQRLAFKRQKLDIKIIKKESDTDTKYELFQRLNTGGTSLTDQEIRNCVLLMVDKQFFIWLKELASYQPFRECISISEKSIEEQFDLELVLRFFAYKNSTEEEIRSAKDLNEFLTNKMLSFCDSASDDHLDIVAEELLFKQTFDLIINVLGDQAFKRYDSIKSKFVGAFLISAFEAVALGIGFNIEGLAHGNVSNSVIAEKIESIWSNDTFRNNSGSGSNVKTRLPILLNFGKELFRNEH